MVFGASDIDVESRRDASEMGVQVIAVDTPRRITRRPGVVAASAEVADDEDAKLARLDRSRLVVLVGRDVQRNFGAVIAHRLPTW